MVDDSPVSPPGAENFVAGATGVRDELQTAEKQVEQNYSALMDTMEASVATQGDWFLSLGKNEGGGDRRVKLLRDVSQRPATSDEKAEYPHINKDQDLTLNVYTFVTKDGIKTYSIAPNNGEDFNLSHALAGDTRFTFRDNAGYIPKDQGAGGITFAHAGFDKGTFIAAAHLKAFEGDELAFGEKVTRSIEMAGESKLTQINKQAAMARNLSSMISSLPPRQ